MEGLKNKHMAYGASIRLLLLGIELPRVRKYVRRVLKTLTPEQKFIALMEALPTCTPEEADFREDMGTIAELLPYTTSRAAYESLAELLFQVGKEVEEYRSRPEMRDRDIFGEELARRTAHHMLKAQLFEKFHEDDTAFGMVVMRQEEVKEQVDKIVSQIKDGSWWEEDFPEFLED